MSAPKSAFRQSVQYAALLLGGFACLSTVLLVIGNQGTAEAIKLRQQEDLQTSLSEVVPATQYNNNLLDAPLGLIDATGHMVTVYRGKLDEKINALAWEISSQAGYSGEIRLLMSVNAKGEILGVRALAHAETPGLGDKIEANKSDWILKFNGLSLGNPPQDQWKVKKDGGQFDSFSGATITPRAVVQAIEGGLEFYRDNQEKLRKAE
jgi:electron transport complex protein RnfG